MKKNISKILYKPILATLALAISVLSFNFPTVNAGSHTSVISLETQAMTLSADVPMSLPITVDSQGTVTTAPDAVIRNTSPGKIKVENISVATKNQWELNDFNTDYGKEKVNQKKFGLSFNKDHVKTDGSVFLNPANWPSINPGDSSPLKYNATVSMQTENTNLDIAEVTFVIGWDTADGSGGGGGTSEDGETIPTNPDPDPDPDPDPVDPPETEIPDPDQGDSGKSQGWIDDNFTFINESWAPSSYGGYFKYTGTDTEVTIPTTIQGYPITDTYKMFENTSVEKVINTNPNITNMSSMFSGSTATTLDLSDLDTSNVTDMSRMFFLSKTLNILGLENLNTTNVTDMNSMFSGSQVFSLDLSPFDTSKVTNMSYMFHDSKATYLDLSSFDTSNVTNMLSMFHSAEASTIKGLANFDTSKVTNMSDMFSGSTATTIDLSSFNTTNVTNMNRMFYTSKIDEIRGLENFDTSKVTDMGEIFSYSHAKELDLSSFDTSNITSMEYMFRGAKVINLDLTSFDTSNVTNMSAMFNGSETITLDLSSFDTSKVTDMDSMFFLSKITTGYARTQSDANKFNASHGKPAGLTFTVK